MAKARDKNKTGTHTRDLPLDRPEQAIGQDKTGQDKPVHGQLQALASALLASISTESLSKLTTTQKISCLCSVVQRLQASASVQNATDLLGLLKSAHAAQLARLNGKELKALAADSTEGQVM